MIRTGAPLAIGADRRLDAAAAGDIHAAGNHGLMGLGAALGVEDIDRDAAALEDAGALAEFGDGGVPLSALRYRDLEQIVGPGQIG